MGELSRKVGDRRTVTIPLTDTCELVVSGNAGAIMAAIHAGLAHNVAVIGEDCTKCSLTRYPQSPQDVARDLLVVGAAFFDLPAGGFDKLREAFPELVVRDHRATGFRS